MANGNGNGGFFSDPGFGEPVYIEAPREYAGPGRYDTMSDVSGAAGETVPSSDAQTFEGDYGSYTSEESGPVAGPDLVDASDVGQSDTWLGGGSSPLSGRLQQAMKLGLGGPYGLNLDTGGGNTIMPVPGGGGCPARVQSLKSQILYKAACFIGKRISAKAIVRFIVKWGAAAAANATGLAANELLALFFDAKKGHRRRGPHLYTVVKRIRQGHRYEHMLARYARKTHAIHPRHHYASAPRRRHARRR